MVPTNCDAFGNKPCVQPCTAGLFHFYANDKAMVGLRTGSYPDGAIIAEELLEWLASSKGGGKEGYRSDGVRPTICAIARKRERYFGLG